MSYIKFYLKKTVFAFNKGNPYSTEDLIDESDSEATTKENTKKRSFQIDDDDDDDEPAIGSAHKKHRVQNLDNFLDDEAEDDDDDDDDEYDENNISLGKLVLKSNQLVLIQFSIFVSFSYMQCYLFTITCII